MGHTAEIDARCSCGPHAVVFGSVPDPGCPFHGTENVCDCGDYRRQHVEGKGRCRVCQPLSGSPNAPWNGCKRFRHTRVIPPGESDV